MTEKLRTPDDRFENLPGYQFGPNYLDDLKGYEGLRIHYLDEPGAADGPEAGNTFLCLHGQPSWCYLYRKMLPVFTAAGGRVVAPDLLGFGRSDKPVEDDIYTYHFHRDMLKAFVERLDLTDITLVCQDWGGILGLTLVPDMADRFIRLIVMNTAIPVGDNPGKGFEDWRAFNRSQPDLDVAALFKRAVPDISDAEAAAYGAPFPDQRYKAGVRRFPDLVMTDPKMEGVEEAKRARRFWSEEWTGQSFMAVGMQDPVLGPPAMKQLQHTIRGCPDPMQLEGAGHFVQEHGEPVARAALDHFAKG